MTQEQEKFKKEFEAIFTADFIKQVWADMHEMTSEFSKFEGKKLYHFKTDDCPQVRLAKWEEITGRKFTKIVPIIEVYFPSRVSRITGKSIPARWLPMLNRVFHVTGNGVACGNWKDPILQDIAKLARCVAIEALDNDILGIYNGTICEIPSLTRHKL